MMALKVKEPKWVPYSSREGCDQRRLMDVTAHPIWMNSIVPARLTNANLLPPTEKPGIGFRWVNTAYEIRTDYRMSGIIWSFRRAKLPKDGQLVLLPEPGSLHWACATPQMEVWDDTRETAWAACFLLQCLDSVHQRKTREHYAFMARAPELDDFAL